MQRKGKLKAHICIPFYILENVRIPRGGRDWHQNFTSWAQSGFIYTTPFAEAFSQKLKLELFWGEVDTDINFVTNNRPGRTQNNRFIHPESTSWLISCKARAHLPTWHAFNTPIRPPSLKGMKRQRVTCHVCSLKESNLGQASWQEHLLIHVEQLQIHGTAYSGSHQALGLQQHCHTCSNS